MPGDWTDWKAWLNDLNATEKLQVRKQLNGISASTLSLWGSGKRRPSKHFVRMMARFNPLVAGSLQAEFPEAFRNQVEDLTDPTIPRSYQEDIIDDRAMIAEAIFEYTVTNKVYYQMVSQFDPEGDGLLILPAMCYPDEQGIVRSLIVTEGYGTGPWKQERMAQPYTTGDESLAGQAVRRLRPMFYPHQHDLAQGTPAHCLEMVESAGAFPILLHGSHTAGALFIGSAHENFFIQARRNLGQRYANLYALGLFERQFYPPDRVRLQTISGDHCVKKEGVSDGRKAHRS